MHKIIALLISVVMMLSSCAVSEIPEKIGLDDIGRKIKEKFGMKEGSIIVFKADKENPTSDEMNTVAELLEIRLKNMGYTEADITVRGANRIRVEIPSLSDPRGSSGGSWTESGA